MADLLRVDIRWTRRWRSLTITDKIPPIHPGEVLMEDFINGFEITQNRLAVAIGVPPRRVRRADRVDHTVEVA